MLSPQRLVSDVVLSKTSPVLDLNCRPRGLLPREKSAAGYSQPLVDLGSGGHRQPRFTHFDNLLGTN